ncbi:hypothetical protein CSQ85_12080 [Bifidobacterium rousetti]|uniref:helix-turn-helix domain-containing protein n=1 Tax=Bifidobacterium rousetti TaxID=2045439 RepID=UPI0012391C2E|nr:hypothetical protein [Bifidobacterium rousetti]KAA8816156.1 hypothetical protein CSQ85_12080 [Bifidobacterium rousetti]
MTPAEFKSIREHMGLPHPWLAALWQVTELTVKRYERKGVHVPPEYAERLLSLLRGYLHMVEKMHAKAIADDGIIRVSFRDPIGHPVRPSIDTGTIDYPASYWRAVACDTMLLGGNIRIVYAGDEDSAADNRMPPKMWE